MVYPLDKVPRPNEVLVATALSAFEETEVAQMLEGGTVVSNPHQDDIERPVALARYEVEERFVLGQATHLPHDPFYVIVERDGSILMDQKRARRLDENEWAPRPA